MNLNEHAIKAEHSLGFAVDDLQALQGGSKPVAEILWRLLLQDAINLRDRVNHARQAMEAEVGEP